MSSTFGIEEEYLLVDLDSGALVPRSSDTLDRAKAAGDTLSAELNRCQVEIATEVCEDLADAEEQLRQLRSMAARAAAPSNARPAALASHPFSSWYDQELNTDKDRYVQLAETYQQVAWQQAICGCHVHVGIEDRDLRVAVMDRVRPWLPVLLALSANSPFWDGIDTGYASYRTIVWRLWPTAAVPPRLGTWAAYQAAIDELVAIEAIESPKSLYWYVRPSGQYETVEFRVCDVCTRPADAVTLAGLIRGLVTVCAAHAAHGVPHDVPSQPVLDSAMWRAARYGMDGTLVDPTRRALEPAAAVARQLLDFVRPGLEETGDTDRVTAGVDAILTAGNGATAQRSAVARGGTPAEIVFRVLEQ